MFLRVQRRHRIALSTRLAAWRRLHEEDGWDCPMSNNLPTRDWFCTVNGWPTGNTTFKTQVRYVFCDAARNPLPRAPASCNVKGRCPSCPRLRSRPRGRRNTLHSQPGHSLNQSALGVSPQRRTCSSSRRALRRARWPCWTISWSCRWPTTEVAATYLLRGG